MRDWSEPYNFGAVGGLPPGWSVRYSENNEMWFAVTGDDPDNGNTGVPFCTPWGARQHAINITRGAVQTGGQRDRG